MSTRCCISLKRTFIQYNNIDFAINENNVSLFGILSVESGWRHVFILGMYFLWVTFFWFVLPCQYDVLYENIFIDSDCTRFGYWMLNIFLYPNLMNYVTRKFCAVLRATVTVNRWLCRYIEIQNWIQNSATLSADNLKLIN